MIENETNEIHLILKFFETYGRINLLNLAITLIFHYVI